MNYELGIRNKKKLIPPLFILIVFIAATIVTAHVFAANQVKTTETFILSAPDILAPSTATSSSFSLYIGDSLSGVTNPVKSAQVAVSGVYTGNGSVNIQLGSDLQTFTLANASNPTPFEILYDASSTTASISSAGTYNYTLTVSPSAGVTVYGLGAKMVESHEYVPASCADGQPANEKIKTTETFILSAPDILAPSTATSSSFSLYIGDILTGVTNPVKSAQVAVSGVYTSTAQGSITVQLGSDSQVFTMAHVGSSSSTPFEIFYDASSTTASISSAGTYEYTLTITPSAQVTIYGLGAKMVETHRYAPPSCSAGYMAKGSIESSTFDTGVATGAAYNSIIWTGALGTGNVGRVRLQIATSNSSAGPWNATDFKGPGPACDDTTYYDEPTAGMPMEIDPTCSSIQNKRYFRYKTTLCSKNDCVTSGNTTPRVDDVIINWSP